jgi:hypothetical protein
MSSWYVTACLVLLLSITALAWLLVRAQHRQFTPAGAAGEPSTARGGIAPPSRALAFLRQRPSSPGPEPGAAPGPFWVADDPIPTAPGGLARVASAALESASRMSPRNSSEADALAALRRAAYQAERGRFAAEVRTVIEGLDGVQSWHDIRKLSAGGPTIDHLAVGPRGVFVIDPVVRTGRLTCRGDVVFAGTGYTPTPDPMLDEVLAKVAVVAPLVQPVPVQALIVLDGGLTLPPGVVSPGFRVRGVQLTTRAQLAARVITGLPLAAALDVDAIWARLFPAFGPALDAPDHPFSGRQRAVGH